MLGADRYYGEAAVRYEAERAAGTGWKREQAAVERTVAGGGAVLDVPCGTGRFWPHYEAQRMPAVGVDISSDMLAQARARYPGGDFREGDALALPFAAGAFRWSVCTRFLHWIPAAQLGQVLGELFRVAREVVFSIRLGVPDESRTVTHSEHALGRALAGAIELGRTRIDRGGYCVIHAVRKPPGWLDRPRLADAVAMLSVGARQNLAGGVQAWAKRYGLRARPLERASVSMELWSHEVIGERVDACAAHRPQLVEDWQDGRNVVLDPPRRAEGPLLFLRLGPHHALIDGRHRAAAWRTVPGRYPVLVLEA